MRFGRRARAFTLPEAMLAICLVAMTMGMLGLLFQRSFIVLRVLDDKERARQAGRMGLDRMTSELREATLLNLPLGELRPTCEFEKINPSATAAEPFQAPDDVPPDYVPPEWTPLDSYPDSERLEVRYSTADDALIREVKVKTSASFTRQIVVVGVNSFSCKQKLESPGEVEVSVSVIDSGRVVTLSSRVLCPCIKEPFE